LIGFEVVFAVEFFHAAGGVQYLLFAGIEGVADVADFHLQVAFGGPGLEGVAAGTANGHNFIFGVNSLFHLSGTPL